MKFQFVQFHAEPVELVSLLRQLATEFGLHMYCGNSDAKSLIDLNSALAKRAGIGFQESPSLVVLAEKNIEKEIGSFADLEKARESWIYCEVGIVRQGRLAESSIGYSKDKNQFETIQPTKVLHRFKSFTKAGVTGFNAETGAEARYRTHRYTQGAKVLFDSGIKIVPFGGGRKIFYKLE